jgi:flagellar L-ring protein precursor FlgH
MPSVHPFLRRSLRVSLLALAIAPAAAPGAALRAQNPYVRPGVVVSVAADLRARGIGDVLTIAIVESHSVKNEDKVERSNDTTLAARLEAYSLSDKTFKSNSLPRIDIRKEQDFEGEAKQRIDSDVRASIAVIVVDVQPNGNMVVAGQRTVTVNDETKTLRISGIVRAYDVTGNNTVTSAQVADARIEIHGDGANTRQVTKGPLGQMFDTLIWFAWPF